MTDNQMLSMVLQQLGAVAEKVDSIRDTTQDTRERVIRLEEQRAATLERLSRVEGQHAAFGITLDEAVTEVAELRGEVGASSRKVSTIASTIASAIAGAVALLAQQWGKP